MYADEDDLLAELTFDAEFSHDEVELNLNYHVWGALYEADGAIDRYIIWFNGDRLHIQRAPPGNQDEFVVWFDGGNTRPEEGR